jgi:hypothetical protein
MARTTQFANSVLGAGKPSNALYGSDLMVQMLRELGIRYIALNPGASLRGLRDSLVIFGENASSLVNMVHVPRHSCRSAVGKRLRTLTQEDNLKGGVEISRTRQKVPTTFSHTRYEGGVLLVVRAIRI